MSYIVTLAEGGDPRMMIGFNTVALQA